MKSVGVITFHRAQNFGAVLQAFALQQAILSLGHDCRIIDYRCRFNCTAYPLFHCELSRSNARRCFRTLANLRSHLALRWRFARFRSRHLILTEPLRDPRDLREAPLEFDTFVTGSDQVWHPQMVSQQCLPAYFLNFVHSKRRLAYGPSFGVSEIPIDFRNKAAPHLVKFDFLSAREETGCKFITELTGRTAAHVLDPTFLLRSDIYTSIASAPTCRQTFLLLYPMEISEELNLLARSLRDSLGIPIVAIVPIYHDPQNFSFADQVVFDAGPAEFLGWMQNATFVCTNSFHGTAFSIIYRKNFFTVAHSTLNGRSYELLKRLGLLDRQMSPEMANLPVRTLLAPIDYETVVPRLHLLVDQSHDFLRSSLA